MFHIAEVEKECQTSHCHLDIFYEQRTSLCYYALSFLLMKANFQTHTSDWKLMVVNKHPASARETTERALVSVITEQSL